MSLIVAEALNALLDIPHGYDAEVMLSTEAESAASEAQMPVVELRRSKVRLGGHLTIADGKQTRDAG